MVIFRPALLGIAILMGVLLWDGIQTAEAVH